MRSACCSRPATGRHTSARSPGFLLILRDQLVEGALPILIGMPHPHDDPINHTGVALLLHERNHRGRSLRLRRVIARDRTPEQRDIDVAMVQVFHHLMGRQIIARVDDQRVGFDPAKQFVFGQQGRRRRARNDADPRCFQARIAERSPAPSGDHRRERRRRSSFDNRGWSAEPDRRLERSPGRRRNDGRSACCG